MIERREVASLGTANHGWLDTHHHFSFADYFNPQRLHWGGLRVWNDDTIEPGTGFPPHPHASMEIITYVIEGAITHEDSTGNKGRTRAGDVQVMSAGTGIRHSEYNLEATPTRLFQIWIPPASKGGKPTWGTQPFPKGERSGRFVALASGMPGDDDALPIRTPARVLGATVAAGGTVQYAFMDNTRCGYLVPAKGSVDINGVTLQTGDGAAIRDEQVLTITARSDAELVLVDTPANP